MGGASRTDPAPDQDTHCRCQPSWRLRLSRLPLRARHEMATGEEPGEVQRSHPAENQENAIWLDETNHRGEQPNSEGLDELLQTQHREYLSELGPMGTRATAYDPAQAPQGSREGARERSSAMAKCLLRRTRVNLLSLSPGQSGQCSSRVPLTGEPDAGKPPVRFGGRGRGYSPVPTPIQFLGRIRQSNPMADMPTARRDPLSAAFCISSKKLVLEDITS